MIKGYFRLFEVLIVYLRGPQVWSLLRSCASFAKDCLGVLFDPVGVFVSRLYMFLFGSHSKVCLWGLFVSFLLYSFFFSSFITVFWGG